MKYRAKSYTQIETDEIPVVFSRTTTSVLPVVVTASSTGRNSVSTGVNSVLYHNFGIDAAPSASIRVTVHAQRHGANRIIDKTIQQYDGALLGENYALDSAANEQTYTMTVVGDPTSSSWGILVDLEPNINIPQKNLVQIFSVDVEFI